MEMTRQIDQCGSGDKDNAARDTNPAQVLLLADRFDGHELLQNDVILQQMPMMHAGGLLQTAYALCRGACPVLAAAFDETVVLDTVQPPGCTALLATPTMSPR